MRFTQQFLKGLAKPGGKRRIVFEDSGLAVRVGANGSLSWLWRYDDTNGVRRQLALGSWPAVSLVEARQLQAAARLERARGGNPGARGDTFANLWAHFEANRLPALAEKTRAEYARQYRVDLAPAWGKRKAKEITRRDVSELVLQVKARALKGQADSNGTMANRVLALAGAVFAHGVAHGIVESNPAHGLKAVVTYRPRERILTPEEIRALWGSCGAIPAALKFALVTGQRIGAVALMAPGEVVEGLWTIPVADGRKLRRPNRVPLSGLAAALLPELRPLRVDSAAAWCQRNGAGWRPHDLRRTALTGLRELGVSEETAGRIAGHRPATLLGQVYDRGSHLDEIRAALNLWAGRLSEIVA